MRRTGIPTAVMGAALCVFAVLTGSGGHSAVAAERPDARPAQTAQPSSPPTLDSARGTLEKWVETQQIISREKKDWQQGRDLLKSRIQLVKDEIGQLRQEVDETHKGEQEFLKSRSESVGERDSVKSVSGELAGEVAGLEEKVRTLYTFMPESMRDKVKPLYDRMPPPAPAQPERTSPATAKRPTEPERTSMVPATAKVTVAERYQNVLGILNEMNRLNGEITVASEIRSLSDGKPSEVKTIYLGLGQAWYLSARGEAGVGRPTPDGWKWQPAPEVATQVGRVLEMIENKSSPKFVPLPVTIQ